MSPRKRVIVMLAALVSAALVGAGAAYTATPQPAIQTITPRTADSITNLDVLRQQIRNYYGDPLSTGVVGADSNYVKELSRIEFGAKLWLALPHHTTGTKAILLDVDDTTLVTWNYELFSNWAFNPTTNGQFVTNQQFQPVPGMVDVVNFAAAHGYAVFFLTGRGAAQEPATLGNLTTDGVGVDAGYPTPTVLNDGEDGLFTKPAVVDYPPYLQAACAGDPNGSCTTSHYKTATREHIESLGYDIVANFGDQFSDLTGGFADKTFKMPNPNYFLP